MKRALILAASVALVCTGCGREQAEETPPSSSDLPRTAGATDSSLLRELAHSTDWCRRDKMINSQDHKGPVGPVMGISHNIPATVAASAEVEAQIEWRLSDPGHSPVAHDSVFADWSPRTPLAHVRYGFSSETTKSLSLKFTAPEQPGRYRIRWMHIHAFKPIHSFFGGTDGAGPMQGDYATSPHVWMEVPIEVR